jgi:hypothetical protein
LVDETAFATVLAAAIERASSGLMNSTTNG